MAYEYIENDSTKNFILSKFLFSEKIWKFAENKMQDTSQEKKDIFTKIFKKQ